MKSLSIIGYGLNEEKNIHKFIKWSISFSKKFSNNYEIIYIDDGSTDSSRKILHQLKKKYKNIKLIFHKSNRGSAYCFKKAARLSNKKFVLIQMIDLCYNVNLFLNNKNLLFNKKIDCLHGYRKNLILNRSDNLKKSIISFCNYFIIGVLFGFKTKDFQNTYLMSSQVLKSVKLYSKSSFINAELILKLINKKIKIKEVEVNFIKRSAGVAKGTRLPRIFESIIDIFKFRILYKKFF